MAREKPWRLWGLHDDALQRGRRGERLGEAMSDGPRNAIMEDSEVTQNKRTEEHSASADSIDIKATLRSARDFFELCRRDL